MALDWTENAMEIVRKLRVSGVMRLYAGWPIHPQTLKQVLNWLMLAPSHALPRIAMRLYQSDESSAENLSFAQLIDSNLPINVNDIP